VVSVIIKVGIIGDIILDTLLELDRFPNEDSEVKLLKEHEKAGGSAFNTAFELLDTDVHPYLLSTTGDDYTGDLINGKLSSLKLDQRFIIREKTNTGRIYILISPGGKRTMLSSRSQNPIPNDLRIYDEFIGEINWLHISGYLFTEPQQQKLALYAMKKARDLTVPVSVDPGTNTLRTHPREVVQALQFTDYFLPNREEYQLLNSILGHEDASEKTKFIVKDGPNGVFIVDGKSREKIPTLKVSEGGNTTGAGDSFNAGFIFGMLTTADIAQSCKRGNDFAYRRIMRGEQT